MTVYFQGAEREDFVLTGTTSAVLNFVQAGMYNSANTRGGIRVSAGSGSGAETATADSTSFSASEFWCHWVGGFTASLNTPTSYAYGVRSGGQTYLAIGYVGTTTVALKYWNGSSLVTLATAQPNDGNSMQTVRYAWDLYIKVGPGGVGRVQLYMDGLPIISTLTLDTTFGGTVSAFDTFRVANGGGNSWQTHASEVIIADWNTIGSKLVTLVPNATGTYSEFAGAGYTAVDEIVAASDIVTSPTANERLSAGFSDPPALASGESIESVAVSFAASTDGSSPQNLNTFVRIGGTDYHGTDQSVPAAIGDARGQYVMTVDPSTSAQWQVSNLSSAEFGIRSRA